MYLFRPPARGEGPRWTRDSSPLQKALYRHIVNGGTPVTVVIDGGVVIEYQTPTGDQLAAADSVFPGGVENITDDTEGALLIAAGYEPYMTYLGPDASPGIFSDLYTETYTGVF